MCKACEGASSRPHGTRRNRLWELDPLWHCVIVGTCLTLADLRGLVRKLGYQVDLETVSDYELHSHFVGRSSRQERASKLLNKILDRKHAAAVRRFSSAATEDALLALWQNAFAAGEIPGPLWAAASHPALTLELGTRIYGDVHMLSHLVGAANRADVRSLRRLEQENADLREKLGRETRRNLKRGEGHDQAVARLNEEVVRAERAEERAARLQSELAALRDRGAGAALHRERQAESPAIAALRAKLDRQGRRVDRLASQLNAASEREGALQAECAALERLLAEQPIPGEAASAPRAPCPFDLDGRCILYVGGRTANVCRLRTLVQQWNGELLHHDGGLEKSIDELASAVTRADAVVFPADCVSHNAVKKLKLLCRRNMKPFVPLRSAGLSSFVAALRDGVELFERPEAGL